VDLEAHPRMALIFLPFFFVNWWIKYRFTRSYAARIEVAVFPRLEL
jgi:hypothetical protein